jgi:hypothetical protein
MQGRMRIAGSGISWLYVLQPDPEHAGQRRTGELSAPQQATWGTMQKPDRRHLNSITVKMISVACKFDVHPTPETLRVQQRAQRRHAQVLRTAD